MRRPARYSRSPRSSPPTEEVAEDTTAPEAGAPPGEAAPSTAPRGRAPGRAALALMLVVAMGAAAGAGYLWPRAAGHTLTQKDIDAAVLRTLQTNTLPSPAAKAADIIRPSEKKTPEAKTEKRGRNMAKGKPPEADGPPGEVERGVGTGVVIVDKGVILTNLHVVAGADKIRVTFFDGLESPATITGVQPEN
ncbi:MAG: peptidase S1, partial [Variovorax paradoxus]